MKYLKKYKIFESFEDDYVDSLLDKISKKGIDSLSDSEKNRLNKIVNYVYLMDILHLDK